MSGRSRPWWKPRRNRWKQRTALAVVATTLAWGGYTANTWYDDLSDYPSHVSGTDDTVVELTVPRGTPFQSVLGILVDQGVLATDEATLFKLFVLHRGATGKITAGEHQFRHNMTAEEKLAELCRKQPAPEVRVTIPEGKHLLQIAEILASKGLVDTQVFIAATRSQPVLDKLEIPGSSVEGYLFPDTYKFPRAATPEQIITKMVERHEEVYSSVRRNHQTGAQKLSKGLEWDHHEIVTLASIVEKETGAKHERPLIAGVFLNRLRFRSFQPKYLATDPTIIYGCTVAVEKSSACKKFDDRIRRIHLRDKENPYNTYTHVGLPPGPISNPGRAALQAVFAPKKSRFLYFVSRNDGTHKFSASLAEHEAAVDKFQRGGG